MSVSNTAAQIPDILNTIQRTYSVKLWLFKVKKSKSSKKKKKNQNLTLLSHSTKVKMFQNHSYFPTGIEGCDV